MISESDEIKVSTGLGEDVTNIDEAAAGANGGQFDGQSVRTSAALVFNYLRCRHSPSVPLPYTVVLSRAFFAHAAV